MKQQQPGTLKTHPLVHAVLTSCTSVQEGIKKLESIVHPLVAKHRQCFLQRIAEKPDQKLVVLDIPLLFETHGEDQVTVHMAETFCLPILCW